MKQKEFVALLISVLVIVFAWIGFNIYHNFVSSTIPESAMQEVSPISASFDTQTIDSLKQKSAIPPLFELQNSANSSAGSTNSAAKTPEIATNSASSKNTSP